MERQLAYNPLDTLDDNVPVTVGMLRDAIDDLGQGVGFALGGALHETGVKPSQCRSIAEALHSLSVQGAFHGPAQDVVAGIVYGMLTHLEGAPDGVGKRTL